MARVAETLAEPADAPTDDALRRVATLAEAQRRAEGLVKMLEEKLKGAKEALRVIVEDELPRAMVAAHTIDFTTDTGLRVQLADTFRCGQLSDPPGKDSAFDPEAARAALRWLSEAGHGDLARRVVAVTLGKDSEETALELIRLLRTHPKGNSLVVDQNVVVPWNTLAAFAREQTSQGADPPLDLLHVTRVSVAKVTRKEP